ncbi:hypothetical protein [Methylobacterium dankookense]|uniref:Uncharacterized protein n=1 Tax=Methylobacterium dankookense TaxID=560405 RepID=A0A564G1K5_9HYPH|nr:hypothetical protein [Methylobacterium dankookense]GJD56379.1 hypothetical protein IFDJLNFL_2274 [Methylobacterium dankookense]VUF14363.1 hypothetical protein MTDSW087_04083 [Methylobacterium dankookense]
MQLAQPIRMIGRLGLEGRAGAIVQAEQAVDTFLAAFPGDEQPLALDILLRDAARLRDREPGLDAFLTEVEHYIDLLFRDMTRAEA